MASRTIVIGDIHGCYDELKELLKKVKLKKTDRVVAVGDLVSKGPKTTQVLDLFMTDERFSTVIGNHDLILRRTWNGETIELKKSHKEINKKLKKKRDNYLQFLNGLPFMIDLDTHLVVHAGLAECRTPFPNHGRPDAHTRARARPRKRRRHALVSRLQRREDSAVRTLAGP